MTSEEVKAEYTSSLADLTCNSKPLINVLTMLAEENLQNAGVIVEAIEAHLAKVNIDVKLPILYLIDCIVKNVGQTYTQLFSKNIVSTFCNVFKTVDEKTRAEMFKLRQTWNEVFAPMKLYFIDMQIKQLDPAWPVTAQPPSNNIHLNPKFLKTNPPAPETKAPAITTLQEELLRKQKELVELEKKKLELEVLETQFKLQNKQIPGATIRPTNILLKPEVAKQMLPLVGKVKAPVLGNLVGKAVAATPRINPVNSALVTAVGTLKPTRDPRLLRQQAAQQAVKPAVAGNTLPVLPISKALDSNNKNVTSVRDTRNKDSSLGGPQTNSPSLADQTSVSSLPSSTSTSTTKSGSGKTYSKMSRFGSVSSSSKSSPGKSRKSSESPTKKKSSGSSSSSSSRHKKKGSKDSVSSKKSKSESSTASETPSAPVIPTAFKGIKGSTKNRNYVRRNLTVSPELIDCDDVVIVSSPIDLEKSEPMDVDLRKSPAVVGAKKRLSSEAAEQSMPSKKTKNSSSFDVLFGDEDTDLRQLPVVSKDRPPTPPPPIISLIDNKEEERLKDENSFEAVRAKLAHSIFAKSLPKKRTGPSRFSAPNDKIIISADDEECIKAGKMTKEQSAQLLNKIIMQVEQNKLREAKEKLAPISDEDGDEAFSEDSDEVASGDRDERKVGRGGVFLPRRGVAWQQRRRPWEMGKAPVISPWNTALVPQVQPWVFGGHVLADNKQGGVAEPVSGDEIKRINIDGVPRDIRYYDETAVVFMSWDDPRDISFQNGVRRVTFNEADSYLLSFNEPAKDVPVNGSLIAVRLGAPSRELYVEGRPYECFFGGQAIVIDLHGKRTAVKLDGPAPQVKIGTCRRTDLVAGKVNLIVNAKTIVPVFLDAKKQQFDIDGDTVTLRFVDALKTVLINDVPFNVEFGGLPKPVQIHNKKHFIRFSVLPKGCRPGDVQLRDMPPLFASTEDHSLSTTTLSEPGNAPHVLRTATSPPIARLEDSNTQDNNFIKNDFSTTNNNGTNSAITKNFAEDSPDRNSNSPQSFHKLIQQQNFSNLDVLSNAFSSTAPLSSNSGYQVEESIFHNENSQSSQPSTMEPTTNNTPAFSLPANLNINDLFQKLVATGIVTTNTTTKEPAVVPVIPAPVPPPVVPPNLNNTPKTFVVPPMMVPAPVEAPRRHPFEFLKPVLFSRPETLKVRQMGLYSTLYSGMQCSSCGMRFPPEQSMQYSQHLDWHFRQNRKGKKNIRVAASRRWYYSLSDWKNYEEIEDLEEREKNYFDQQLTQTEQSGEDAEEETEVPSVPADSDVTDSQCEVCHDKFDQFFNEEKEEWHLRNAIRIEDKTYHPVCYEDQQAALLKAEEEPPEPQKSEEMESKAEEVIPGLEIILDDDDEDEPYEPEEVIIEESDDSKLVSEAPGKSDEEDKDEEPEEDGEDDDVILNEVAPVKIVVDDDDDEEMPEESEEKIEEKEKTVVVEKMEVDDGFVDVGEGLLNLKNGGGDLVKIKQEPVDPDDVEFTEIIEDKPEELPKPTETMRTNLVSSIDGNIEMAETTVVHQTTISGPGSRIKINISKPLPVVPTTSNKDHSSLNDHDGSSLPEAVIDPSQPLPPGEEPVLLNIKPTLQNIELKKQPTVCKGSELTGLCNIM